MVVFRMGRNFPPHFCIMQTFVKKHKKLQKNSRLLVKNLIEYNKLLCVLNIIVNFVLIFRYNIFMK